MKATALILALLLFCPAALAASQENFTIIVLPDTQFYSESSPQIFTAQTEWIASQISERNIVFVSHVGDLVQNRDTEAEWESASANMAILEGKVPYGVLPGNHDMLEDRNTANYNRFFPFSRFSSFDWYGSSFPPGKNDNSYQLFSALGTDFIALHIGFCPTQDVIQWANTVLQSYSNRKAIITTHGYLGPHAGRHVHAPSGGCQGSENTQYIWDDLIYSNENVFLVLCGHVHSETARIDQGIAGQEIIQLLADYQELPQGGEGWLRILEFAPSEKKLYVKTYSPYLQQFQTDRDSEFVLDLWFHQRPRKERADPGLLPYAVAAASLLVIIATLFFMVKK